MLASRPYRCDAMGTPPAGHVALVAAGQPYLNVGLRPGRGSSSGWRTRRFCTACAVSFGLALEVSDD